MTLQNLLDLENITKYQLSKASGIPKTTVIDICSGKTTIENVMQRQYSKLPEL